MIVQGAAIVGKAVFTAYQQALHSKSRTSSYLVLKPLIIWLLWAYLDGKNIPKTPTGRLLKGMRPDEAMKVLNIEPKALNHKILEEVRNKKKNVLAHA